MRAGRSFPEKTGTITLAGVAYNLYENSEIFCQNGRIHWCGIGRPATDGIGKRAYAAVVYQNLLGFFIVGIRLYGGCEEPGIESVRRGVAGHGGGIPGGRDLAVRHH